MKRLFLTLVSLICVLPLCAQNTLGKADDLARIVLTPLVVDGTGVPAYANNMIKNKLNQIVTQHGVGGNCANPRFVITANLVTVTKDVTATMPPMVAITVAPTIYVGDGQTGELYASCQLPEVKGVGENDTKAYVAAIRRINVNSPEVVNCINTGKAKIIEYYNTQIDFLLAEADAMTKSQLYDDAMMLLATVPSVCKEAYERAMAKVADVYQTKIDVEGAAKLNQAYAQWHAHKTEDSALIVVGLLAEINPMSKSAAEGRKLVAEVESHYTAIEQRRREIEERNWAFKMQQYQDAREDKKAELEFRKTQQTMDHEYRTTGQSNDHEYRMTSSKFNYEVEMERARNGAYAAEMALNEVKSVVATMSPQKSSSSSLGCIAKNVLSWLM